MLLEAPQSEPGKFATNQGYKLETTAWVETLISLDTQRCLPVPQLMRVRGPCHHSKKNGTAAPSSPEQSQDSLEMDTLLFGLQEALLSPTPLLKTKKRG